MMMLEKLCTQTSAAACKGEQEICSGANVQLLAAVEGDLVWKQTRIKQNE